MATDTYKCTSIYSSFQDGGEHAGKQTVVVKLFGCNLQCQGFGQEKVGDPDSWVKPWEKIDITVVKSMSEAPLFRTGCDSAHSWHDKFKDLAVDRTAAGICDEIQDALSSSENPSGLFMHPESLHETRLVFSGGEPMLQQGAIRDVLRELSTRENCPRYVIVETNGTIALEEETHDLINLFYMTSDFDGLVPDKRGRTQWTWSISPKIRTSGELKKDAINIEVLGGYSTANDAGQLIFVVDGENNTWYEISLVLADLKEQHIFWPVYITTTGSWVEDIEPLQYTIQQQAREKGFYFIPRSGAMIKGNTIDR